MTRIRCAIYTRKSSEEGLEQGFNSLDAQREACAAYILSQASEGWQLLPDHYDDGGLSGGTLERPALQRLLAAVKEGRIDIIVVYKVDRLTRSLLDFSRLVETFDAAGTSFVSVTQSFNTTTSMGRLTLNMLLSFAQFEREVTAERIRDKIAASKAKGMWMGGTPPLGYRPDGRSLAIVEEHAMFVRDIFARYCSLGTVRRVAEALASEGIRTPRRVTGKGQAFGGCLFTRGQLYTILRNPIYAGDIAHKGKVYPGNHPPIIERATWDAVQQQLSEHVQGTRTAREKTGSLLAGMLVDDEGEPLTPVHTTKGKVRYRYYVSTAQLLGTACPTSLGLRLPAREIEQLVRQEVAALLADPVQLLMGCGLEIVPAMLKPLMQLCGALASGLAQDAASLRTLISRIAIHPEWIELVVDPAGLAKLLGIPLPSAPVPHFTHRVSVRLTRTGRAVRLVQDDGVAANSQAPDPALIRLLLKARRYWAELSCGQVDISTLAQREAVTPSYLTRVVRLAFLAPAVVEAILAGTTRADVDGMALLATGAIPASWDAQVARFLPGNGG